MEGLSSPAEEQMDWHVTIFGDLEFPAGGVARWRALSPDPDAYDDAEELGGAALGRAKVDEALAAFAGLHELPGPPGRVDVTAGETAVKVRGYLIDEGRHAWLGQIVSTLRAASEVGARGAIYVVHIDGESAYEIAIDPKKGSKVSAIKGHKKIERIDRTPAGEEATALYTASFGASRPKEATPATGGGAAEVSRAIASKLLERPAAEVYKVLLARDRVVALAPGAIKPTKEAFPTPTSFTDSLRSLAGADPLTAIALDILARLEEPSAPSLAMRALSTRVGAATAAIAAKIIAAAPPANAADGLLDAIDVPPLEGYNPGRDRIVATLKTIPGQNIGDRALSRITPALVDQRDAAAVLTALLDVAEARSAKVPEALWLMLLRRDDPSIRVRAGRALLASGSRAALPALAEMVNQRGPLGEIATNALFTLDPMKAFDAVSAALSSDLTKDPAKTIADNALSFLCDDAAKHKAKAIGVKDARWIDLALRAPTATGAVLFLGYTGDPRVAAALAALIKKGIAVEDACESLKRIGDPSVVPALQAALPEVPHPYTKKLLQKTIEKLSGKPAAGAKTSPKPTSKPARPAKK